MFCFFLSSESTFCTCKCYPVRNTKYTESMMRHVVRGSALPLRHSHSLKSPCEMMAFDDFQCSSHVCSVDCRTLSDRNAFLKNKFAKYHHFLSLSILFLSIEDETIPPPLVGYILSKYLRDSFKKFCNTHTHTQIRLISSYQVNGIVTWMAVNAATIAGEPKPCDINEKWVRCRCIDGSKMCCGRVLHKGDRS